VPFHNAVAPTDFSALFAPTVRVQMPWAQLLAEEWPVEMRAITDAAERDHLHLPWYRKASSRELVSYEHPRLRPVRVGEFPRALKWQSQNRQSSLLKLTEQMRQHHYPQLLTYPAAALDDGRLILLDGCHHIVSVVLAKVPFSLALFIVHPPAAELLVDLGALARVKLNEDAAPRISKRGVGDRTSTE
jgi:hypothetical protein